MNHEKEGIFNRYPYRIFGVLVAYALTMLFASHGSKSNITPKRIFDFDLTTGMQDAELGPGDYFQVTPVIKNVSTERMYVFIKVVTPDFDDDSLYEYSVNEPWLLVEKKNGTAVYAYVDEQMQMQLLSPGDSTFELMNGMTIMYYRLRKVIWHRQ